MPRPTPDKLTSRDNIELSPVREVHAGSIMASLGAIIHWSDSHEVRRSIMDIVDFPINDMTAFLVVNQLAYRGALRPTELARILGTGRPNMTKITTRLEGAGLVTRTADPDDHRGVLIALTHTGRTIGERIVDHADTRMRDSLDAWSDEDRKTLGELLGRLAAGAEAEGYRVRFHG